MTDQPIRSEAWQRGYHIGLAGISAKGLPRDIDALQQIIHGMVAGQRDREECGRQGLRGLRLAPVFLEGPNAIHEEIHRAHRVLRDFIIEAARAESSAKEASNDTE